MKKATEALFKDYKQKGGIASLSSFFRLRPKHIRTICKSPLNQCLCEYCTNVKLKLTAINSILRPGKRMKDEYSALSETVCDIKSKKCMYRECKDCGVMKMKDILEEVVNTDGPLYWYRWQQKKMADKSRMVLHTRQGKGEELVDELVKELEFLSQHIFRANWQQNAFDEVRRSPLKDGTVLTVNDFAENYSCFYQEEVQSAHWHYQQVSLHPTVAYYKCKLCPDTVVESLVFISNDLKHDHHAVHRFNQITVKHLQEERGLDLKKLIQWSDGCAAQYKSKGPFADLAASNLDFPGVELQRNYFGSRHGKGPSDGESAVIKHRVTTAVKGEGKVVSNAEEFYNYCVGSPLLKKPSQNCDHKQMLRSFFYVNSTDIKRDRQRDVDTVKGTRQFHQVKCGGTGRTILTRHLSCLCVACLTDESTQKCPKPETDHWMEHTLQWSVQPPSIQLTSLDSPTSAQNVSLPPNPTIPVSPLPISTLQGSDETAKSSSPETNVNRYAYIILFTIVHFYIDLLCLNI